MYSTGFHTAQSVINHSSNQDLAVGLSRCRSHADTNTCVTKWDEDWHCHSQGSSLVHPSKHKVVITEYTIWGTYYQVSYYTNYLRMEKIT